MDVQCSTAGQVQMPRPGATRVLPDETQHLLFDVALHARGDHLASCVVGGEFMDGPIDGSPLKRVQEAVAAQLAKPIRGLQRVHHG